jgi:hypothetical protein
MLRTSILIPIVAASIAAAPVAAIAEPAALHTAAIPDGDRWVCFVWDDGVHHATGCERDEDLCELALSNAIRAVQRTVPDDVHTKHLCAEQAIAWVATAARANGTWTRVAAPDASACAARTSSELSDLRAVSACVQVGRTSAAAPDAALIPTGHGWWCIDASHGTPIGSQCFRARTSCPGRLAPSSTPCHAQPSAWLYTNLTAAFVFRDAAACERDRLDSLDRSACAKIK